MSILLTIIAPVAFALQTSALQTSAKPLPDRPAPPVVRPLPRPPYAPPQPVSGPRYCNDGPRAALDGPSRSGLFICIDRINGRRALMTVTGAGHLVGSANQLDVATALAMLADTRLQSLWPQLETILGPDGTRLRDEIFAAAEAAWRQGRAPALTLNRGTMESMNDADARAVLDYALDLDRAGRGNEALILLDRALPQPVNGRLSDERQYEYLSYSLRRAQNLYSNRRFDEAIADLERLEANELIYLDYRINATVNKAAHLVELGRHGEALAAIDRALDHFRRSGGDAMRIDGSSRQFAWIRACALHHLGRTEEARTALWPLDRAPERQWMANAAIPPTSSIALRAAFCLDDDARVADVIRPADDAPYPWPFANVLQANFRPQIAGQTVTLGRALARLAAEGVAFPVRQLPDRYAAALSGWRPWAQTAQTAQTAATAADPAPASGNR
jgi:tetratricopeptide (TPR) repeat protein